MKQLWNSEVIPEREMTCYTKFISGVSSSEEYLLSLADNSIVWRIFGILFTIYPIQLMERLAGVPANTYDDETGGGGVGCETRVKTEEGVRGTISSRQKSMSGHFNDTFRSCCKARRRG